MAGASRIWRRRPAAQDQVSMAMVALLAAVVAVFVFIASTTIYLRHCSDRRSR